MIRSGPEVTSIAVQPMSETGSLGSITGLLRYRGLLIGLPLLFAALGVASALLGPPRYSAESRFVTESAKESSSQLMGLAAQFGLNVSGLGSEGESLEFYAELIRSRGILKQVASSKYPFDGREQPLVDIYEITAKTERKRVEAAMNRLEHDVRTNVGLKSGLITVITSAPTADLAVRINRRLLELVNEFNLEHRQTQAAAERQFVESRFKEAESSLREAEGSLTTFYERNRRLDDSPELKSRAAGLERRVSLRQQVYTALAQSLEEARISEVRNLPVVTVVDAPEDAVERTSRGPIVNAILWGAFGGMLAIGAALALARLQRERAAYPEQWAELRRTLLLRRHAS
jgi:uncharacterized protein involved in exopolysaccharide biosynthesis